MYVFKHDGSMTHDGSGTYGRSADNAVLRHQLNQAGYPTSGVSTSPHRGRAIFYALRGGQRSVGVVLTIDQARLAEHEVVAHVVSDTVITPSVAEDEEVILVGKSGGTLPCDIVCSIEIVRANP
ncbi:hypothetical protein ABH944_007797 [Caballeronia udeis]|uniref:Uncharacterized protein n=1 Tax=Caballeronia udeis TaxID=1232866 RepID=A0ABW8MUS3_9BURK